MTASPLVISEKSSERRNCRIMSRFLCSSEIRSGQYGRRDVLRVGALSLLGTPLLMTPASAEPSIVALPDFGRAKRCLVLYIYGAWSQLDTFDPTPEAPESIRGEFGTIDSKLPGVRVCEHLPRSANVLDRCTLVRSMSHPWNIHSASYTLTGNPDTERIEGRQRNPDQWPYIGGVIDYCASRGEFGPQPRGVPVNVMLPWRQSLYARPNKRSGTFGGFLGTAFDPLWTEFRGEAPQGDPFREITPDGRLEFGSGDGAAITLDSLDRRRSLLTQFEQQTAELDRSASAAGYSKQRELALDFLARPQVVDALRLEREPMSLREDYGMTLFGQSCLSARRLLEANVKFVTVCWDEFGQTDESWDTHYDHHSRMREFLLPAFDKAFSALMLDLDRRELLDDTLVLCLSEHGRTPTFDITAAGAPGRGHWSRAYCQLFAGAGVPRGQVVGSTNAIAGDVLDRPIDPKDILRTAYHLLGVDADRKLIASPGRSVPLVAGGQVVRELLG